MSDTTKPTSAADDAPFLIHALRAQGFNYVAATFENNPFGVKPGHVPFGGELVVTPELRDANRDRNGVSWLEFTAEEQTAAYGSDKHRFGYGPVSDSIRAQVAAARRAELAEQRRTLINANPGARAHDGAVNRLAQIDAELAALDSTAQAS